MKRLTLDETWVLCLKMWKWIAMKVRAAIKAGKTWNVNTLKKEWLEKHGFEDIVDDCFFCDFYDKRRKSDSGLGCLESGLCPGRKVDDLFDCATTDYHYCNKPIAFYKKLCELYKLRLAKKRKVKEK